MSAPDRSLLRDEVQATADRLRWLQNQLENGTCAEVGHDWKFLGGMNCGCFEGSWCSLDVMQCTRCGDCDYGDAPEAAEKKLHCADRIEHAENEETSDAE